MQFSFRVAAIIAAIFASALAGNSTPSLAITLDKPLTSVPLAVSEAAISPTNGAPVDIVPPVSEPADVPRDDQDARTKAQRDFETLAAAVAAQDHPESVDDNLGCMAGAIYFEAKGEPLAGQLAVAQVILNRTKSGRFPKSICSVVTQRGQFSFVRAGQMPAINRASAAYLKAVAVARVAIDRLWDSSAGNALYFHAASVSPGWRKARIAAIGHHIFYR